MGAGAARKLAADGFRVAILSSSGKGEALAEELGGLGLTGSNQSNDDLKRLTDQTVEKWGRADVLVKVVDVATGKIAGFRLKNMHTPFSKSVQILYHRRMFIHP